ELSMVPKSSTTPQNAGARANATKASRLPPARVTAPAARGVAGAAGAVEAVGAGVGSEAAAVGAVGGAESAEPAEVSGAPSAVVPQSRGWSRTKATTSGSTSNRHSAANTP